MNNKLKFWSKIGRHGLVLFGHGFTCHKTDNFIEHLHQDFNWFQQTITMFETLDFQFISMTDLLNLAENKFAGQQNWLHLTFDDGYQSLYTLVYPYLKAKKIPFSLFVSTHHIETHTRYYTYRIRCAILHTRRDIKLPGFFLPVQNASRETRIRFCRQVIAQFKMMNKADALNLIEAIDALLSAAEWADYNHRYSNDEPLTLSQLQALAADGLAHIGAHNHHHLILNQNVAGNDVLDEMQTSKLWLQKNLGVERPTYCYPNGKKTDFSPTTHHVCQQLGYQLAFTLIRGRVSAATNRYEIPRCALPANWGQIIGLLLL